jgi:hypothetical protein
MPAPCIGRPGKSDSNPPRQCGRSEREPGCHIHQRRFAAPFRPGAHGLTRARSEDGAIERDGTSND